MTTQNLRWMCNECGFADSLPWIRCPSRYLLPGCGDCMGDCVPIPDTADPDLAYDADREAAGCPEEKDA